MSYPTPVEPTKKDPTIWIILGIAGLLVFCAAGIGLGALILYLRQPSTVKAVPPLAVTAVPTRRAATLVPPIENGPLVVEAYDPTNSNYNTLASLATDWVDIKTPGTQHYSVTVSRNTPIMIFQGWCTTTSAILEQNFPRMSWTLVVDNTPVSMTSLYLWNNQESDRICRTYVGLIPRWTGTSHTIITIMTIHDKINDGWDDYPAGDYSEMYTVSVTP